MKILDIEGRLRRKPYATVAEAVGMGFVFGGGLFTRLGGKMLGTGLRLGLMAVLPRFEEEIIGAFSPSKLDTQKDKAQ
jgi:hypothetical protein